MEKRTISSSGIILILLGGIALLYSTVFPILGLETGAWRLGPFLLTAVGAGLVIAPITTKNRNLAPLFIPGVPVLVIAGMLLWGNLFGGWDIWAYFWPMILLGTATGFFFTSVYMRNVWFLIPAIIVGVNAAVFQFSALFDAWDIWSYVWPTPLFSVALALLVVGEIENSAGMKTAGKILSLIAGFNFALMGIIFSGWVSILGSLMLIGVGGMLLLRGTGQKQLPQANPKAVTVEDTVETIPEKSAKELEYDVIDID